MTTLRETIRLLTASHLDAGHIVCGQCLSAVGFVANTVPNHPKLTELPMSDVAGAYFAVGAALVNRRPLLILRYQGFAWFAASAIVNYAAKSKEIWGRPCPMLIRSIAMEGRIGPTSGSSHHALAYRMPGVKIYSPMTPWEWKVAYEDFMAGDDVMLLSEHRSAYDNGLEMPDSFDDGDITLYPISVTRFAAEQAAIQLRNEGITVNVVHLRELKPLHMPYLSTTKYGMVIDDDYPDGIAKSLAFDIQKLTGSQMCVMGLEDRTAGFAAHLDNLPPSAEKIVERVRHELGMNR